jgi:UDP-glucose 4-epimerase
VAIYANNEKAVNDLGWKIKYDLNSMMKTAWDWEVKIKEDETLHALQNPLLN